MSIKLVASIPAFHERLFLDYAIKSIYNYVDEIILTDVAMQASLNAGFSMRSTDGTLEIIDKWVDNKKIFLAPIVGVPCNFRELMTPAFDLAKSHGADWYFTVGADEIWPDESMIPMRSFLELCDRKGILGLNVWMNIFAPDFWHCKDFRNPRLARITPQSYLMHGDAVGWSPGVYQFAGDCNNFFPPWVPPDLQKINSDYPKMLRAFHYSCVGEERVKFKVDFYKQYDGTIGDKYNQAYMEKKWEAFNLLGFHNFTGKHPSVILNHPLYTERLY